MAYQKKTKGLRLLRMTGSQALARNNHVSFSPSEIKDILDELDKCFPVANDQVKPMRHVQEIADLQAEVERLRKAGDAVVADLEYLTKSGWFNRCKSVKQWNAAKEGKPSV